MFLIGGVWLGEGVRGLLVGEHVSDALLYRGTVEFGVAGAFLTGLAGSPLARTWPVAMSTISLAPWAKSAGRLL